MHSLVTVSKDLKFLISCYQFKLVLKECLITISISAFIKHKKGR